MPKIASQNIPFSLKSIALFLIVAYILNFQIFLKNVVLSVTGIEIGFLVEVFLLFPLVFILFYSLNIQRLKLPHFIIFLSVELLFVFLESSWFRGQVEPQYQYPYYLLIFYSIYIFLVNFGTSSKDVNQVVSVTLGLIYLYLGTLYLIYLGVIPIEINFADSALSIDQLSTTRIQTGDFLQQNGTSLVAVLGIFLLLYNRENELNKSSFKILVVKILLLLGIIIIHASRGALLVVSVGLIYFLLDVAKSKLKIGRTLTITLILVLLTPILVLLINDILNSILILQRFTDETQNTSRMRQVYVTWVNFLNNPWFGVGYYNAGRGVLAGYTRSNVHYTQILASNGIFYFMIYITFIFKVFFAKKHVKGIVSLFGPVVLISLMFYNWSILWPIVILAYLVHIKNSASETMKGLAT